jgi:hypothetical protein
VRNVGVACVTKAGRQLPSVGSTVVGNDALRAAPIAFCMSTVFATSNCGRWPPPRRQRSSAFSCRPMHPSAASQPRNSQRSGMISCTRPILSSAQLIDYASLAGSGR